MNINMDPNKKRTTCFTFSYFFKFIFVERLPECLIILVYIGTGILGDATKCNNFYAGFLCKQSDMKFAEKGKTTFIKIHS